MRYECDDEAFVGDFVELSDSWSRAQVRTIWAAADGEDREQVEATLLACLRPKIIALHLTCVDAPAITTPDDLTPERTEQMDERLYRWFANVWWVHLRDLANLGNALGRRLYSISVPALNGAGEGNSRRPVEPPELLDAWLLDLFPGRTLEELDQMDLNRLYRARIAGRMQAVEGRRKRFLEGKLKGKDIDADEWKLILLMDEASKEGDSAGGG